MTERMTAAAYRAQLGTQTALATYLRERLGVEVVTELVFHPTRNWALDVALPVERVGVEVHGFGRKGKDGRAQRDEHGRLIPGAHHSITGRRRDMRKLREAVACGWAVGEFESDEPADVILDWVRRVIALPDGVPW